VKLSVLVMSTARRAVELYFWPIRRLWARATADYRDLAARDFLWELHSLSTAIAEGCMPHHTIVLVAQVLHRVETVLDVSVARTLDLSALARLLTVSADLAERETAVKVTLHAAFVAGYVAGLLETEVLPSRHVRTTNAFFKCHEELVLANRQLRRLVPQVNIA
jgi:hypothetical protein